MNRLDVLFWLLAMLPALAGAVDVECRWGYTAPDKTQVLLESTMPIPHRILSLDQPDRVVIDLPGARLTGQLPPPRTDDAILIGIRAGLRRADELRLVLDLKGPARVKSFSLQGSGGAKHRIVVELIPQNPTQGNALQVSIQAQSSPAALEVRSSRRRTALIAIDAGHGGEDPGAVGPNGLREKDVTLAIARKLARLIDREPGMRALMIRDADRYIGLPERPSLARDHKADLFVSIHADAYSDPNARGSSVYTLGTGAASSEMASSVAEHENGSERVLLVEPNGRDALLDAVLHEMTRNATLEHSDTAAAAILRQLKRAGVVHRGEVQHAGFVVLKSTDLPSLLVEAAFISNTEEERLLATDAYQQLIAQAILAGIKDYLNAHPPQGLSPIPDTPRGPREQGLPLRSAGRSAPGRTREHVISQGDTLSAIAKRYQVSLSSLRAENGLDETDVIHVGQVIAIPTDS
ncbi:LysM peptidoglycan-binding domain-containing protein [Caldichromatium japonicum]|uniref:N-acetylmuramoyl-L-alanine amidase n=1 Tax=Caldichromatium japonicum TaxID=2699430 RepID=A0A6G7VEB3_9GAMM|nr:N-acetylmuramoyl-L-alanine amidase [Caldichromatium japonicum]QIK38206.1 LysM peptidoglycan-binding domain-containing protein [Caldichromatium japonicum]